MKERRKHPRVASALKYIESLLTDSQEASQTPLHLMGHIDLVQNGIVMGWVVDNSDYSKNVAIDVVADGVIVGQGTTSVPRSDLKSLGYGDGRHGYHIPLHANFHNNNVTTLTLRESESRDIIKTNKFRIESPVVVDAHVTETSSTTISGRLNLESSSAFPISVTLVNKQGRVITESGNCSTISTDKNTKFTISTENIEAGNHELCLVAGGIIIENSSFQYSTLVHDYASELQEIFYGPFYIYTNNLSGISVNEAFDHYITHGIYRGYNPNPWVNCSYIRQQNNLRNDELAIIYYLSNESRSDISCSELFSPELYRQANSDIGSYSPLAHQSKYGVNQNRNLKPVVYSEKLLSDIRKTSLFEPDIAFNEQVPVHRYPRYNQFTFLTELITEKVGHNTKVLICVPFLSVGGADYIATRLAAVLAGTMDPSDVTVLITDTDNMTGAHWLPKDVNLVVFEDIIKGLPIETRAPIVHKVIATVCPEIILNINSHVCWEVYLNFGRYLAQYLNLYAYIFCFDYDQNDRPVGYVPTYLEDTIDYLSGVFSDNQTYIDQICGLYGYTEEKASLFQCAYTPVEENLPRWTLSNTSKKVLWCGRLGRQKKIDMLVAIAESLPNVVFDVFGPPGDSPYSSKITDGEIDNIHYLGVYNDFSEIEFSDYGAFLYTANWDGLPTVLINMMGIGIPVVSSDIGGINELLKPSNSVLIDANADATDYARELVRLLFIENNVTDLSANAISAVNIANSQDKYRETILQFIGTNSSTDLQLDGSCIKPTQAVTATVL